MKRKFIRIFFVFLYLGIFLASTAYGDDYRIGAEDVLKISVWETPGLDLEVSVLPDGKIAFPLVGDLQAAGLTIAQLREEISARLQKYIKDPIVTVIVSDVRSYKVYIQGEVARPGTYALKKRTTILELLADAGGTTPNADLRRAFLLRDNQKTDLDFYLLLEKEDISQNILLEPNDILIIPNNFAKRITVVGEVKQAQILTFKEGLTVLDAILMVGGVTPHADLDDTLVIRKDKEGIKELEVDMEEVIKEGIMKHNIPLLPGDTIIVGESLI